MTPEQRFADLWTDYLEGDLDAAGMAELEGLLVDNESLQRLAADHFQTHRLLGFVHQDGVEVGEAFVRSTMTELPRGDAEFVQTVMSQLPTASSRRGRFEMRMLAALACGLLVGVLMTSAAWVYAMPRSADGANNTVLLDEGFESGPAPSSTGIPVESDRWAGDFCELVGESQAIRPAGGRRMLRFLRADYENKPKPSGSYVSDIYRLIDVRPRRAELEDGGTILQLSAGFNAGDFPAAEKYQCSMSLYALDAETALNGSARLDNTLQLDSLAYTRGSRLLLDHEAETWQRLSAELRLPPNTDFVLVRIGLAHATAAQRRPEFPGHYLDNVKLVLARRAPLP